MRSIGSLNFRDVILRGADSTANTTTLAWEIPGKLMESIESNHNESQLEAIRVSIFEILLLFLMEYINVSVRMY